MLLYTVVTHSYTEDRLSRWGLEELLLEIIVVLEGKLRSWTLLRNSKVSQALSEWRVEKKTVYLRNGVKFHC